MAYDKSFLARVSWLYYKGEMTQHQIADTLRVSRTKVVRALAAARDTGMVKIELVDPFFACIELETKLQNRFPNLKGATVIPNRPATSDKRPAEVATSSSADNGENLKRDLGLAGAMVLGKLARPGAIIGTGWGSTIRQVAIALDQLDVPDLTVVQLVGGPRDNYMGFNEFETAHLISEKLRARFKYLYAPAMAESVEAKNIMIHDPSIREVLDCGRNADIALIGIGSIGPHVPMFHIGFLSEPQIRHLIESGAVGDVISRYFDQNGRQVDWAPHDCLIGLSLEDLSEIDFVLAVAGGTEKAKAILGALRGGFIDYLVTDESATRKILEAAEGELA